MSFGELEINLDAIFVDSVLPGRRLWLWGNIVWWEYFFKAISQVMPLMLKVKIRGRLSHMRNAFDRGGYDLDTVLIVDLYLILELTSGTIVMGLGQAIC